MSKAGFYLERLKREVDERGLWQSVTWATGMAKQQATVKALQVIYRKRDAGFNQATPADIIRHLNEQGYGVEKYTVDKAAYQKYLEQTKYPNNYFGGKPGTGRNFEEKTLEHFVSLVFLDMQKADVLVDVACSISPFAGQVAERYACQIYRQDLVFPQGINGIEIGGSATAIPLPSASVSKMTLHCSFEHFEGSADTDFLKEVSRLLKPGGKVCIIPLYLMDKYYVLSDPLVPKGDVVWDAGAPVVQRPGWGNRFGRHYGVSELIERVLKPAKDFGLNLQLYHVTNATEIHPSCYLKFFALIEKP
jgi:SAM-dependent methyltransferase